MQLGISEIVRNAKELEWHSRIAYLRAHKSTVLEKLLQLAFDARIQWLIPRHVAPPYRPNPPNTDIEGMLYAECRRLYIFLADQGAPEMAEERRGKLFVQLLEGIDCEDAKFLISVKDQRVEQEYGLTLQMVQEAFPGLIEVPIDPIAYKPSVPSVAVPIKPSGGLVDDFAKYFTPGAAIKPKKKKKVSDKPKVVKAVAVEKLTKEIPNEQELQTPH